MLKVTKSRTVTQETLVAEEQMCTCDSCKKVIFRKKLQSDCENIKDYYAAKAEYLSKNPKSVTYYNLTVDSSVLSTLHLCKNCLLKEIEDAVKTYEHVTIEKVQTECFEGDVS